MGFGGGYCVDVGLPSECGGFFEDGYCDVVTFGYGCCEGPVDDLDCDSMLYTFYSVCCGDLGQSLEYFNWNGFDDCDFDLQTGDYVCGDVDYCGESVCLGDEHIGRSACPDPSSQVCCCFEDISTTSSSSTPSIPTSSSSSSSTPSPPTSSSSSSSTPSPPTSSTSSSSSTVPCGCQYCCLEDMVCPGDLQDFGADFAIDYSLTDSDHFYKYEVRELSADGESLVCVFDEDVGDTCAVHDLSFTVQCPVGAEPTRVVGGRPVADVTFGLGCRSSDVASVERCGLLPDTYLECDVGCRYCLASTPLSFNVTTPEAVSSVDCRLHLWYETSGGEWCQLYPEVEGCGVAVRDAIVCDSCDGLVPFSTNELMSYQLSALPAPLKYRWNVECKSFLGWSMASEDWTFTARCPGQP